MTSNVRVSDDLVVADRLAVGWTAPSANAEPPKRVYVGGPGNVFVEQGNVVLANGHLVGASYRDLQDTPQLAPVAISGNYRDIADAPKISNVLCQLIGIEGVAVSGSYNDLLDRPNLSMVALSGDYNDLFNQPPLSAVSASGNYSDLLNKPDLAAVAMSGSYLDLEHKPALSAVAATGQYADLLGKPSISAVGLTGSYGDLLNKPQLSSIATTGDYNSLSNVPRDFVPSSHTHTVAQVTGLSAVAVSGSYSDLSNVPVDASNASNITSGSLAKERFPPSGVSPGMYGSASCVHVMSVDSYGRIVNVAAVNIAIPHEAVSGLAPSSTVDTTNATNIGSGTLSSARLPYTGVVPGTFGSTNSVPVVSVDLQGRVTSIVSREMFVDASAVGGLAQVATTGSYGDIKNIPIAFPPTDHTHIAAQITGLSSVALSGNYEDLQNKPAISLDTTNASNISTGTLDAARLPSTGVVPGTYGSANTIPVANIDALGRVTGVAAMPIAILSTAVSGLAASATTDVTDAANITRGTLAAARLPSSGVTAGTYGNASTQSQLTLDSYGRVTSVANVAVAIPFSAVTGLAASATTDVTDAANITRGTLAAARLPNSGVTAGTYGNASTQSQLTLDSYGRVTSVANVAVAIPSSAVSGLAASATTDTTDAANITKGTLAAARLPSSGVTAGTYGNASTQSQLTLDSYGRVTSVANVAVAIPSSAVTGLAASATTDVYRCCKYHQGDLGCC